MPPRRSRPETSSPVVITVYKDKTFTFITKSPPASVLLKKAAGLAAGSKSRINRRSPSFRKSK